ncbi:hypothetical protein Y1Q_0010502 [Alligator mississippiensis]|uniref:Uncharacterized protein n=1 Tax=Alligator mississippiensis TaxID=8496 RepID=A0A151NDP1_ALLMI|nr:hypothetical protein Y1Q_0010502 [Alligator mississippiensis]
MCSCQDSAGRQGAGFSFTSGGVPRAAHEHRTIEVMASQEMEAWGHRRQQKFSAHAPSVHLKLVGESAENGLVFKSLEEKPQQQGPHSPAQWP